jgi:hypothetical protein
MELNTTLMDSCGPEAGQLTGMGIKFAKLARLCSRGGECKAVMLRHCSDLLYSVFRSSLMDVPSPLLAIQLSPRTNNIATELQPKSATDPAKGLGSTLKTGKLFNTI